MVGLVENLAILGDLLADLLALGSIAVGQRLLGSKKVLKLLKAEAELEAEEERELQEEDDADAMDTC